MMVSGCKNEALEEGEASLDRVGEAPEAPVDAAPIGEAGKPATEKDVVVIAPNDKPKGPTEIIPGSGGHGFPPVVAPPPAGGPLIPVAPIGPVSPVGGSVVDHHGDDDDHHHEPEKPEHKAECGNGKIELYSNKEEGCRHFLYGVDNNGSASTLYHINRENGDGQSIGAISGYSNVVIDFSPDGVLYAIGYIGVNAHLLTLNCASGQATNVATIGVIPSIVEISFDTSGALWAIDLNSNLYKINLTNGLFNLIGNTGVVKTNFALYARPLVNFDLLLATDKLYELDQTTALATIESNLSFASPNEYLVSGDYAYKAKRAYVVEKDGSHVYVSRIDEAEGEVERLGKPFVVNTLSAIAVNQRYEECDKESGELDGTECTRECHLIETDCNNGLDDDRDGFADCADIDCRDQACDFTGPNFQCFSFGVCNNQYQCVGAGSVCATNDCVNGTPTCDVVENVAVCTYAYKTDGTICDDNTNDEDPCIVGTCQLNNTGSNTTPSHSCFNTARALVPEELSGCSDGNVCTADSCLAKKCDHDHHTDVDTSHEHSPRYECSHESLERIVCSVNGFEGICTVTDNTGDLSNDLTCELPRLTVFVSSQTYNGAMLPDDLTVKDLATADQNCQTLATNAGLSGQYAAWLSTSTINAIDRLGGTSIPNSWYLVDNTTLVAAGGGSGAGGLTAGGLINAISKDENGTARNSSVWTGTLPNGVLSAGLSCNDWTSTSNIVLGLHGFSNAVDGTWTSGLSLPCNLPLSIYCFQKPE